MRIIVLELKGQFILVDKNGWFVQFFGERKLVGRNKEEDSKRLEQSKRRERIRGARGGETEHPEPLRTLRDFDGDTSTWSQVSPAVDCPRSLTTLQKNQHEAEVEAHAFITSTQ